MQGIGQPGQGRIPAELRERPQWLVWRAVSCYVTDQNDEAIEALRLAISLYRSLGDKEGEGKSFRLLGEYGTPTHLRECTGWNPEVPLARTIGDLLQWWRARLGE